MELKEKNENVEEVKEAEVTAEGEITDDAAEAAAGGVKPTHTPPKDTRPRSPFIIG